MDKEKVRWAQIALMVFAVGLIGWLATGGDEGEGALNQLLGPVAGIALILALGLFIGARVGRRS